MLRPLLPALALGALAAGTLTATAAPAPASAQEFAGPALRVAQFDPTYQLPHHLRAFVLGFDRFNLTAGVRGHDVPVELHQGTIIRPTGLTIRPHMLVRIDGFWSGGVFNADRIILVR